MLPRRRLLQSALAGLAVGRPRRVESRAQAAFGDAHLPYVRALAAVVLPASLTAEGQAQASARFLQWLRDYRPGAERDPGYGVTALRSLPASPADRYPGQLADLDRRAGGDFLALTDTERHRVIVEAIDAAGIRDLPARPTGGHIATDLMAHYFRGAAANDAAYGRAIGRDACRGLQGSDARPPALGGPGAR
ncbi:MAG: hypothetical protein AB7O28_12850 [Vicinamibacterales bacterium]